MKQMELLPNLYKELMGEDDGGKIWMPSTVNMPTVKEWFLLMGKVLQTVGNGQRY